MRHLVSISRAARLGVAAFVLCLVCAAFPANAATVRGRLDRVDGYGRHYPAPNIAVTVYDQQRGRSAPVFSDAQGMYYINGAAHGDYTLEVWWSSDPKQPPKTFSITVNTEPFSDIAPIIVP